MAEILLLRHSLTKGNQEGRYIGSRTDEPLCQEGIDLLKGKKAPLADRIYVSPMKRCIETANILWGTDSLVLVPELRECDFGTFENKNYAELNKVPAYQAWIDSGGTLPFPDGESMDVFKKRCQAGFAGIVRELSQKPAGRVAAVVHGGTIMAVLERFGYPKRNYFDYQVKNGCGYLLTPVEGTDLWNTKCWP